MNDKEIHDKIKKIIDLINKQKGDPPSYIWIDPNDEKMMKVAKIFGWDKLLK